MRHKKSVRMIFAGILAGVTNGIIGAGGGMILIPALCLMTDLQDSEIFPASVCIVLPISIISLCMTGKTDAVPWGVTGALLCGSVLGGILAGSFGKNIPTKWLHRILGIIVLWGGIRYIC